MDKLSTLAKDFSLDNLESYLLDKEFTVDVSPVYDIQDIEEKYNVSDIKEIGYIRLKQEADLVVFAIKIDNLTERTSKKKQFDIAKKLLEKYQKFYGLFVFYDDSKNFRLSFVFKTTHGTKAKYSHYKRFTFYVSPNLPNKTFIIQLKDCNFTDLNSIKQAFSVEPITKEFYNELQNWYYYAMDQVKFPDDYKYSDDPEKDKEIRNAQSLIRLITRLIFIWFLKEKGLVPSNLFNEKELKKIIKDFGKGNNYYNAILQNLFFATLNKPIEERGWAEDKGFPANKKDFGVKSLYRYEDKLLISKEEVLKLFLDIPFINGGLFDCLDKDKVYIDGFSRNEKKQAKISDELFFSSTEKTVDLSNYGLSKSAKVRGLIDILNSYNFTTDEATPIDQEIALDPELLGKVFENLLASYNPETQTTARKATGSYYTPREIVDYMVEESLREYLKTKVPEAQEILDDLFSYSVEELSIPKDLRVKLIKAIDQVKIIDPACGSGAFPMGILHKLVFLLQKLDPKNETWKEIQLERASKEADAVFRSEKEKQEREKLLEEINENFDESINYPDYARKLYLIENCIYGVDIQPIAIQISKLRFFISLILDQKVDRSKPNFGILTLPNLETKFISANTLIGLEKSVQKSLRNPEIERLEQELKFLRHRYFRIKSRAEKIQLQNEDRELREKLKKALIRGGWGDQVAEKIVKFDIFDQNASTDWFDPEWMFGVRDGFDIVIGNPPYVSTKGVQENDKKVLMQQFGFADDLYNHFYFKGIQLLKEKGLLTYISSKTFWTIQTKKNLRQLLLENKLLQLVDTANPFESAMVDTCIAMVQKGKSNDYEIRFIDITNGWNKKQVYKVKDIVYKNVVNNVFFKPNELNMKIYERIAKNIKPLIEKWWDKISTSKNIEKNKRKLEQYRQSLKPGDITLLGLITEGGQGLATANNGKFIGVLEGTKWADKVRQERPKKLWEFIQNFSPKELSTLKSQSQVQDYLNNLSENQIRELFDNLKEKYGRDIFGQGWLYRIVSQDEIADVEKLTDDEKLNGINGNKTFVPYDKGDKDGNRWWAPTPYYIDWSRENVKFLKENSGKKGEGMPVVRNPQFYFREGFCWTDVNSTYLKSRIKENGVYDVLTMSLFTKSNIPDWYYVCMINSKFISEYVDDFVNSTSHFQINDARQLPIVIPTPEQLKEFERIFDRAKKVQEEKFSGKISEKEAEERLEKIQNELDEKVMELYGLK
jgi:hypothetical protein